MPQIAPTAREFRSVISHLERVLLVTYLPSTHACREPIPPSARELELGRSPLLGELPQEGVGLTGVTYHLASSLSPQYYGFVTGGATASPRSSTGTCRCTCPRRRWRRRSKTARSICCWTCSGCRAARRLHRRRRLRRYGEIGRAHV